MCLCFLTVWFGCTTVEEEHKGATVGAGVGAATGAVLGAAIGKDTKSAVIGGLAGALIGGAIGHYYHDKKRQGMKPLRLTVIYLRQSRRLEYVNRSKRLKNALLCAGNYLNRFS